MKFSFESVTAVQGASNGQLSGSIVCSATCGRLNGSGAGQLALAVVSTGKRSSCCELQLFERGESNRGAAGGTSSRKSQHRRSFYSERKGGVAANNDDYGDDNGDDDGRRRSSGGDSTRSFSDLDGSTRIASTYASDDVHEDEYLYGSTVQTNWGKHSTSTVVAAVQRRLNDLEPGPAVELSRQIGVPWTVASMDWRGSLLVAASSTTSTPPPPPPSSSSSSTDGACLGGRNLLRVFRMDKAAGERPTPAKGKRRPANEQPAEIPFVDIEVDCSTDGDRSGGRPVLGSAEESLCTKVRLSPVHGTQLPGRVALLRRDTCVVATLDSDGSSNLIGARDRLVGDGSAGWALTDVDFAPWAVRNDVVAACAENGSFCMWDLRSDGNRTVLASGSVTTHQTMQHPMSSSLFHQQKPSATLGRARAKLASRLGRDSIHQPVDLRCVESSVTAVTTGACSSLAFSPMVAHWLAVGGADGAVRLWDLRYIGDQRNRLSISTSSSPSSSPCLLEMGDRWQPVVSVSWSPTHATQLLTAGHDGCVRLWSLPMVLQGVTAGPALRWSHPFHAQPLVAAQFAPGHWSDDPDDQSIWAASQSGTLAVAGLSDRFRVSCTPLLGAHFNTSSRASDHAGPGHVQQAARGHLATAANNDEDALVVSITQLFSEQTSADASGSSSGLRRQSFVGAKPVSTPRPKAQGRTITSWFDAARKEVHRLVQLGHYTQATKAAVGLAERSLKTASTGKNKPLGTSARVTACTALRYAHSALESVKPFGLPAPGTAPDTEQQSAELYARLFGGMNASSSAAVFSDDTEEVSFRQLVLQAGERPPAMLVAKQDDGEAVVKLQLVCSLQLAVLERAGGHIRMLLRGHQLRRELQRDCTACVPLELLSGAIVSLAECQSVSRAAHELLHLRPLFAGQGRLDAFLPLALAALAPTLFDSSAAGLAQQLIVLEQSMIDKLVQTSADGDDTSDAAGPPAESLSSAQPQLAAEAPRHHHQGTASLSAIRHAFDSFDVDHSNTISLAEFRLLCNTLGFGEMGGGRNHDDDDDDDDDDADDSFQDDLISAVFQSIDADGSGEIDFDEFYRWWVTSEEDNGAGGVRGTAFDGSSPPPSSSPAAANNGLRRSPRARGRSRTSSFGFRRPLVTADVSCDASDLASVMTSASVMLMSSDGVPDNSVPSPAASTEVETTADAPPQSISNVSNDGQNADEQRGAEDDTSSAVSKAPPVSSKSGTRRSGKRSKGASTTAGGNSKRAGSEKRSSSRRHLSSSKHSAAGSSGASTMTNNSETEEQMTTGGSKPRSSSLRRASAGDAQSSSPPSSLAAGLVPPDASVEGRARRLLALLRKSDDAVTVQLTLLTRGLDNLRHDHTFAVDRRTADRQSSIRHLFGEPAHDDVGDSRSQGASTDGGGGDADGSDSGEHGSSKQGPVQSSSEWQTAFDPSRPVPLNAQLALEQVRCALRDEFWDEFYAITFALVALTEHSPVNPPLCQLVIKSFVLCDASLKSRENRLLEVLGTTTTATGNGESTGGDESLDGDGGGHSQESPFNIDQLVSRLNDAIEAMVRVAHILDRSPALPPQLFKVLITQLCALLSACRRVLLATEQDWRSHLSSRSRILRLVDRARRGFRRVCRPETVPPVATTSSGTNSSVAQPKPTTAPQVAEARLFFERFD